MNEIDRLVAEKVLGWEVCKERSPYRWRVPLSCRMYREWHEGLAINCPPFSMDIYAAWEVVLQMRELGFGLDHISWSDRLACSEIPGEHTTGNACFVQFGREKYDAINNRHTHASGESHSPPMAICLAALGAVGMSESQIERALATPK